MIEGGKQVLAVTVVKVFEVPHVVELTAVLKEPVRQHLPLKERLRARLDHILTISSFHRLSWVRISKNQ